MGTTWSMWPTSMSMGMRMSIERAVRSDWHGVCTPSPRTRLSCSHILRSHWEADSLNPMMIRGGSDGWHRVWAGAVWRPPPGKRGGGFYEGGGGAGRGGRGGGG